jgi:hypothetical protein
MYNVPAGGLTTAVEPKNQLLQAAVYAVLLPLPLLHILVHLLCCATEQIAADRRHPQGRDSTV